MLLPPEQYRALPAMERFRAFLPPAADLSAWFPPPGNQGSQPSCTACATTYALRSYYENRREGGATSSYTPMSPAFVYNQMAEPRGACSGGIAIPLALRLLESKGAPPLEEFSYSDNRRVRVVNLGAAP
ncbi:hypothetical protein [Paramagnetospirillum kuznetsovii]|uniref:hypothetical protein n=1 Tax=Paramagnetospirillum kuznetsovii TaxID=2053833 RepID=UPI0011BE80AD|nr:hypothetical protein [Paramagnetospirillum kuznetsovii]